MMKVYFKDGTTTILSIDYCSIVARDSRVIKAVDLRRNIVLFDRTPKQEG
jgi:hypothetical protein